LLCEYVPSLHWAVAPVGSVFEAVFAAGAADVVAADSDLVVGLDVAGAGAAAAGVVGALDATGPVHSATPPCPLHAPFFEPLVVYEPSLHLPVAPSGGVEGVASAVAALDFLSVFAVLPLLCVASHSATPPCPLHAPRFEALSVYDPSLQRPVAPAGGSSARATPIAADAKTTPTLRNARKLSIDTSPFVETPDWGAVR
jgi:hypothetical protein